MLAIGVVELLALIVGFSPSAAIESALPDMDVPDVAGPEIDAPDLHAGDVAHVELGPFSHVLSWISVGRVPILVLLVVALTSFAVAGYTVQWAARDLVGAPLNAGLASVPALLAAAYATRWLGRWLGRIFPRDHSEAASRAELVGSFATVIRGTARAGAPAEAKTTDLRGRTHYILLEPTGPADSYSAGDRVFLVGRERNVYRAVTRIETTEGN